MSQDFLLTTDDYIKQYNGLKVLLKYGNVLSRLFPTVLINEILEYSSWYKIKWVFDSVCSDNTLEPYEIMESEDKIDFKFDGYDIVGFYCGGTTEKQAEIKISILIEVFPECKTKKKKLIAVSRPAEDKNNPVQCICEDVWDGAMFSCNTYLNFISLNFSDFFDELDI